MKKLLLAALLASAGAFAVAPSAAYACGGNCDCAHKHGAADKAAMKKTGDKVESKDAKAPAAKTAPAEKKEQHSDAATDCKCEKGGKNCTCKKGECKCANCNGKRTATGGELAAR